MNHEGALIAFTLLAQLVAGATILYAVLWFTRKDEMSGVPAGFHPKTPELLLLIGLIAAMFISIFHLGSPRQAVNALSNPGNSWVSREILGLSLFAMSLFLLFLGRWLAPGRRITLTFLFLFSLLSAAALVLIMIRIYMIPVVVTWNSWYTPFSFITTTFVLGTGAILAYMTIVQREWSGTGPLTIIMFLFLVVEAVITGLNQYRLSHLSVIHYNRFLLENIHLNFTIIRIVIIMAVLMLLVFYQRKIKSAGGQGWVNTLIGLAILLVLFEQVAGRWLFFASFVKMGI
jgi:DMSO reductase anchor subunit